MLERERAKEEHRIKTEQAAEEVLRRQARVYIYISYRFHIVAHDLI